MLTNEVRISGGKWRGRKLRFPSIPHLRPTPDRVRQTLFNWLGSSVIQARCLDLFAGSGVLGFEALSRGASFVVFVDQHIKVTQQLILHQHTLQCETQSQVIHRSASAYLHQEQEPFDLVFLDPPFHHQLVLPHCQLLIQKKLLTKKALLYIENEESFSTQFNSELPKSCKIIKQKQTGQILYSLVQLIGLEN